MKVNNQTQTVFVCVYDKITEQILLVLNKDKESIGKPGKWGLPGGGVEQKDRLIDQNGSDQTTINASYRELEEETGLFREFIEIRSRISPDAVLVEHVVDRSDKDTFHQLIIFYAETKISAAELEFKVAPAQTSDVSKAKWVPVNQLNNFLKYGKIYRSHYRRIMFFLKRFGKK